MDAMFRLARKANPAELYCIVNADIILFPDLVESARKVHSLKQQFVLMGRRWDMDIRTPVDFSAGWETRLQETLKEQATLHRPAGSDYFLFPASCYTQLPAFVIGRAGWDNWMIYHARKSSFAAIDATHDITIIHQNHDYSHLPGGQPHYKHPETDTNIRLAGGRPMTRFTLLDTDCRLEDGRIHPQIIDAERAWRQVESWPLLRLGSTRLSNALWRLRKMFSRK